MGVKKVGMERRYNNDTNNLNQLNSFRHFYLKTGVLLDGGQQELGFKPDDLMSGRRLWVLHREEVMQEYRNDLKNPGWRPFAWWRFEQNIEPSTFKYGERLEYMREHKLLEPWELKLLDNLQHET